MIVIAADSEFVVMNVGPVEVNLETKALLDGLAESRMEFGAYKPY
jgi:hypothetical protein